jgi:hydrogenase maturation protease
MHSIDGPDKAKAWVETMQDCVIIGIGNLLHGDDGLGVHAVRYLEGKVPDNVDLVEGGVYSLDLLTYLEDVRHAIFIDAMDVQDEPGAIYRFSPQEVLEQPQTPLSVHDLGLYDLIGAAELLHQCPEHITIIAVQVKTLDMGMDLSPELREVLPRIHGLVMEEINARR